MVGNYLYPVCVVSVLYALLVEIRGKLCRAAEFLCIVLEYPSGGCHVHYSSIRDRTILPDIERHAVYDPIGAISISKSGYDKIGFWGFLYYRYGCWRLMRLEVLRRRGVGLRLRLLQRHEGKHAECCHSGEKYAGLPKGVRE